MCVAIPMKVISIEDDHAVCEYEGVKLKARTDLVREVKVGDYVIIHAGFVIQKINVEDAMETIKLYKEMEQLRSQP